MRSPKELILSLIFREIRTAYRIRNEAIVLRDEAMDKNARTAKTLGRALLEIDALTEAANHWRSEAKTKEKLFCDIVKEIEGAEDLHNLRQTVRLMAYRAENSGIVVAADPDDVPTVIVTDERMV
jgi:hypothetical protein